MTDPLTIHELVARTARSAPDAPAFLAPGLRPLTYSQLLTLLTAMRGRLRSCGIGPRDHVALVLRQGPDAAATFLAVASAATSAPLASEADVRNWAESLIAIGAKALVIHAGFRPEAVQAALSLGLPVIEVRTIPDGAAGQFELGGTVPIAIAGADTDEWAGPNEVALLLRTSGSTGPPKQVPLTQAGLCLSSCRTARSLELGARDRCLNMLPLHHVHGLVAALLVPLAARGSVAFTPGFDAARLFEWLEVLLPTWIPAPPAMHQALLEQAQLLPSPLRTSLRFLRSGSTPLWPALVEGLEQTFGVPVIEAYGMTEVPHITANPLSQPRRGSVGKAVVHELVILDEQGRGVPPGVLGEIVVRGPTVTPGYLNQPEANADAFRDGWFRTGDQGRLDSDGYLFLAGRLKEMINRGGQKVIPHEVDEVLLRHPTVREAAAFAVPHPTLGEDLGAAVVLRRGRAFSEQELRQFVARKLPGFKVPSWIVRLDELPREAGGKIRRATLAETLSSKLAVPYEPPIGADEVRVAAAFEQVLRQRVGRHDNFFSLGGDSLRAAQVAAQLGGTLDLAVPPTAVFEHPTVTVLAAEMARRSAAASPGTGGVAKLARVARRAHPMQRLAQWPRVAVARRPPGITAARKASTSARRWISLAGHSPFWRPTSGLMGPVFSCSVTTRLMNWWRRVPSSIWEALFRR